MSSRAFTTCVGVTARLTAMCRNIRTLYNFEPPATSEKVRAALQYMRKISGYAKPSHVNETAFSGPWKP